VGVADADATRGPVVGDEGKLEDNQTIPPPVTLRDVLFILRRRAALLLFTFAVVVATTLFFTSRMEKVYEAKARVLIERPVEASVPSDVVSLLTGRVSKPLETEIEKIRSRTFLVESMKLVGKSDRPEEFLDRVKLSSVGDSILEMKVKASTAEDARKLANAMAQTYIARARHEFEENMSISQQRLRETRDRAYHEKEEADRDLAAFTSRLGISDPGQLFKVRAAQTLETRTSLEDARRGLGLQEKTLANLKGQIQRIPAEVITGYSLNKNPVIDGYKQALYELETKRKELLFDYAADSEEVKALDVQIEARRAAIRQAARDVYSVGSKGVSRNADYIKFESQILDTQFGLTQTRNNIAVMESKLARLEAEQKILTAQQNTYEALKRKRDGANELWEKARQGLTQMSTSRMIGAPVVKVLDEAQTPREPVSPKPLLNLIMAFGLGAFLGVGMALLAEYLSTPPPPAPLDPNLPLVGGIPLLGSVPVALPAPTVGATGLPAVPRDAPASIDALREIGFTLAHREPGAPVPVILFSGTRTDDTTAALAAQMAAALARDGLRVTLVDADRDHPRLNRVFGAPDAPGLSDVLAGRRKAKEVLYVGADGSLRFLAAGAPDDPTPMTEPSLRTVFRELASERDTDIVVVNGPTVWQVPLVAPLEKAATGTVLVAPDAAEGVSPAESVARARRILSNGYQPRLLGVVVGQSAEALVPTSPEEVRS
jgi:polysaccharide biosynthesis transport protein